MQLNLLKIDNCSEQDTQNLEEYIRQLYTYIKKQLQFAVNPTIRLVDDPANSANPLGATGHYEPETKIITVFITDRHTKDILRSIAHELIHHNQNCNNQISPESDMSEGYAQKDESLRALEEEAYSKGNLLFRDWENQMKENDEQLYESLDNYREKRLRLITEGIYEKFGFSTEFLKEARKLPPQPTLGDEFANAQKDVDPNFQKENESAIRNIIAPGLETILNIVQEYEMSLSRAERNARSSQYGGKRIQVAMCDELRSTISENKGDVVESALRVLYNGVGKLLDHFNTQPDDPLSSSTGRVQDTIKKRKQVWGPKMLGIWLDINVPIIMVAIQTALNLIRLNPNRYGKIEVVYRPTKGHELALPARSNSYEGFILAFNKVKETVRIAQQTPQTDTEEPAPQPGKIGISNDTLKNLSETRQNTLNTLRLLESLTGKGK